MKSAGSLERHVDRSAESGDYSLCHGDNDPWLAEFVRRADAGEEIGAPLNIEQTPETNDDDSNEEKIEALTELICRVGDEPETKTAALLVLMATVENSSNPKRSRTWRSTLPSLAVVS